MLIEILGYLGMAITLFAFSRNGESNVRRWTMIGATITFIYCLARSNYPVAILNGALAVMNAVYLWRERYGSKG